jgi:hypothetical protein
MFYPYNSELQPESWGGTNLQSGGGCFVVCVDATDDEEETKNEEEEDFGGDVVCFHGLKNGLDSGVLSEEFVQDCG